MDKINKLKGGWLASSLTQAVLTYLFGSIAINTGNLFVYGMTLVFLTGTVISIINAIKGSHKSV